MTDRPRAPEDGDDAPGMPRWVKVTGIILAVLALLVLVVLLIGGGNHGPGRHRSAGSIGPSIEMEA